MFNTSFATGIFPDSLKVTKVTPILNLVIYLMYRPVSVIPVISKILERLMFNGLNNYFERCTLLNEKQFGFKAQNSTSMAV